MKHQPYLIQRAQFQNRNHKTGIDSILSFDYMGSAEFEFGALGESLERIRNKKEDYVYLDYYINNKWITVFIHKDEQGFSDVLKKLALNVYRLKEFSAFDSYMQDEGYFKDKFDCWWDISNDIIFWKKNDEFLEKFKTII